MRPSRAASIILLPVLALASPTPQVTDNSQQVEARPGPDWPSLSTLLNRVQPHFLHNVLHQLSPKYQDGIFDEDRAAIASVHASDPVVATKLVHLALKRQNNETVTDTTTTSTTTQAPPTTTTPSPTTTTVAPPTSTTTVSPSSSTTTPSQSTTPPSSSTTPPSSSTTTPPPSSSSTSAAPLDSTQQSSLSSQLASQITASSDPPPTTVQVAPETPAGATPVRTVDGGVVYSTIGGGVATATSRNVAVSFTKSSSTRLSTTTRADGSVETLTSVVIVNAPVTAEGADAAGASATSGGPGLQNGAMGGQHGVIVGAWVKWVVALGAVAVGGVAVGL